MIGESERKEEYDTLPGKRFFTCINYEADGLHYRQPWVTCPEEIEKSVTGDGAFGEKPRLHVFQRVLLSSLPINYLLCLLYLFTGCVD
ncbi:hypothetical protein Bca52824_007912 [Brassica carinata]|uniref:Uncharacterized protein n=1 Tax=Brassica carinata TaxID=52824 RepID=A0A8X7W734_BRACI|nr:hypothetical protein Bca52824_007912 [Brassica carinata]